MNDRITAIRARVLNSRQLGDPRAGELREESLAATEGEPAVLRTAHAIAHYYRHQQLTIHDGELLVGTAPGLTHDTEERVVPAVFGRSAFTWFWPVAEDVQRFFTAGMFSPAGNHTTLDYEAICAQGFRGLLDRVADRLARLTPSEPEYEGKRDFLQALAIIGESFLDLSDRYAAYALELAGQEAHPQRRAELQTIAANCRRTPASPPSSFWEACQCAWFAFFFLPDAPGRVDQYLYPWYRQDVEAGTLTREFAKELLSCLWVKYFESVGAASGVSAHNHLTLGGVRPDGTDGINEVTYLCLEVTEELQLLRPQVGVRWHRHAPRALLRKAVETLRARTALPDLCSDEQIVPALTGLGVSLEDARDFSLSGCHEVIVTGKAQMGSVEGFVNMPKVLRLALGLEPDLQEPGDLSDLTSYDALWARVVEAMDVVAEVAHQASVARDRLEAEQPGGNLPASLVTQDCIERCLGYTQGGARYNFCNWDVIGLANLADSLAVIRALVFEQPVIGLGELVEVLAADWEGHEPLRRRALNEVTHYGNNGAGVDAIAAQCLEAFSEVLQGRTPFRGGRYILGTTAGGENMHVEFGRLTGATPDGRRAGEPLADSLGAAQGRDRHGVTALLNSVASLPHRLLPTATTLNVKLDPKLVATPEGIESVAALIEAHFRSGGQQLQFNLVNREMLLKAKAHPEQHPELMVRVAGYSAPFTSLWDDLQDEIIARTEHAL